MSSIPFSQQIVAPFEFLGECLILLGQTFANLLRRPFEGRELVAQMAFIGVSSIPIVALTSFFSGAVLALYSSEVLVRYGATNLAGGTVALAVTREIAPVLSGIMVAARCGSAMAAQIGSMAVTEQIDALRSLSVSPIRFLVVPRLIASISMMPVLTLLGCYSGLFGGYLVAVSKGIAGGSFTTSVQRFLEPWDFVGGLIKALMFGIIVSVVACQQGLRTKDGAAGVGHSTTNAVVISMVLIYCANFILASVLY